MCRKPSSDSIFNASNATLGFRKNRARCRLAASEGAHRGLPRRALPGSAQILLACVAALEADRGEDDDHRGRSGEDRPTDPEGSLTERVLS